MFTPAYVTRNQGFLVFDTLFCADSAGRPQPQMGQNELAFVYA